MEIVQYIFTIPGVSSFLIERLCQDPLKKFFGCQCQRGATNENLSVKDFCKNSQALRVVNSLCNDIKRGNCRGSKKESLDMSQENKALPKWRNAHK